MPKKLYSKKELEEKKDIKIEILEKILTLATSGFGLVAALAWNNAIKELFTQIFGEHKGNLWAMLGYAILVTILVVVITLQLSKLLQKVKKSKINNKK